MNNNKLDDLCDESTDICDSSDTFDHIFDSSSCDSSSSSCEYQILNMPYYVIYYYPYFHIPQVNEKYYNVYNDIDDINKLIKKYNNLVKIYVDFLNDINKGDPINNPRIITNPPYINQLTNVTQIPLSHFGIDFFNNLLFLSSFLNTRIKELLSFKSKISNINQKDIDELFSLLTQKIN